MTVQHPDSDRGPGSPRIKLIRPDWPAPENVQAFTTTRGGGHSQGVYASFNLGARRGDDPQHVAKNRSLLRSTAILPTDPAWLIQNHGTRVVDAAALNTTAPQADASFSTSPGVVCAVLTADCLPVLFCDDQGQQVAASHAGWRGLAAGILEATVAAMQVQPEKLLAWMGPAIGPLAYQVGNEVRDQFITEIPTAESAFLASDGDRWLADLYALASGRLKRIGVNRIYGGEYCTHSDPEQFFSYRRDGVYGCMASCIWYQA